MFRLWVFSCVVAVGFAASSKRATIVCSSASDCTTWGSSNCAHNEMVACELSHGTGVGSGEMNCVCAAHGKRAERASSMCSSVADCTTWGSSNCAHNEVVACELAHGTGVGSGERACVCEAHGKRAERATIVCSSVADCTTWGSSNCAHNEMVACKLSHGTGVGSGEMNCVCAAHGKRAERASSMCSSVADCTTWGSNNCAHNEVVACELAHGTGVGSGERACVCEAHGKRAERATIVCSSVADCTTWGSSNCAHNEMVACKLSHGTGVGSGEMNCVCAAHGKRAERASSMCSSVADCTTWGSNNCAHNEVVACELAHGTGVGSGERACVCEAHGKRAERATIVCSSVADCTTWGSSNCAHNEMVACKLSHGTGVGSGEMNCVCAAHGKRAERASSMCSSVADCTTWGSNNCAHNEVVACELAHGTGVGSGERACACEAHGKRAERATIVCSSVADCTTWGSSNCAHNEMVACKLSHGTGVGSGEMNCVCTAHGKRAERASSMCSSVADCTTWESNNCAHNEVVACELAHGTGVGSGERACVCEAHGKRAERATIVCSSVADCTTWGSSNCAHNEMVACKLSHGTGVGSGEMNCVCAAHGKRAERASSMCSSVADCTTWGSNNCAHNEVVACELAHGTGVGSGERACVCEAHGKRAERATIVCSSVADCTTWGSSNCAHNEMVACKLSHGTGVGSGEMNCVCAAHGKRAERASSMCSSVADCTTWGSNNCAHNEVVACELAHGTGVGSGERACVCEAHGKRAERATIVCSSVADCTTWGSSNCAHNEMVACKLSHGTGVGSGEMNCVCAAHGKRAERASSMCSSVADCTTWGSNNCAHNEVVACELAHGTGVGSGERACACEAHGKRAERATIVCSSVADCTTWGSSNCAHNEMVACKLSHGTGVGSGEMNCVCAAHGKRAERASSMCSSVADCTTWGSNNCAHNEVVACELAHGTGVGSGERACVCEAHGKRAERATIVCSSVADCTTWGSSNCAHNEMVACKLSHGTGVGSGEMNCVCAAHGKRAERASSMCSSVADCTTWGSNNCAHNEVVACELAHGTGVGSGERACACEAHGKRAERATIVCSSVADCTTWGSSNCAHNEMVACKLSHGTGVGSGEMNCVCAAHGKRAERASSMCSSVADCTTWGSSNCAHNEVVACELAHGTGVGSGERACVCEAHGKRAERATIVCSSASDCITWGSSNCAHNEVVACELAHGTGVGSGEMNCACEAHGKRAGLFRY